MYSTLLQLRNHVETEQLERTFLEQLVQRVQKHFALLQPQIELIIKPATTKHASQADLENKMNNLEKRFSAEIYKHHLRLNACKTVQDHERACLPFRKL